MNFKPSTDAKNAPFPTLFDVLFDVTDKLGYNVEVKWPQTNINGGIESDLDSFYEINRYCDEIISMANRNGGKRFMYYRYSITVCLDQLNSNHIDNLFVKCPLSQNRFHSTEFEKGRS